ncbi:glycosyltransferase family 2 protein [Selenihalanaerobacter shriftii]|uniref:Glycosyl transferase family 2 n=1 Tax=Selenihalanaerobacter shriftii TaxID=142842 RepID=A0A1T4QYA7_9FIRM|nr:glycosyltransferase family A protein [Selenihalanaerobacter shriftii]SKA08782.1 Glycosyl transferase family 2 [Selenihalanaerobacter shriftii]
MLLSILIPTYNRDKSLKKNLYMIKEYINKNNLIDDIKIIISNNCSTDDTRQVIDQFCKQTDIITNKYNQNDNLGLEGNALFVLEKADTEYVMYLSDDDYLDESYLVNIVDKLKVTKEIYCVLPSIQPIRPNGEYMKPGRDMGKDKKIYNKGFENCLENSWRGHQLTGVTFKKKGTYASYRKNNVNNIYPFIYFVAYNCLRGKTWHFTEYPVKVTVAVQEEKDWGYEEDGLISEIFDSYKKLDNITSFQRSKLELKMLDTQTFRYQMYLSKGVSHYLKALKNIEFGNNTSLLTRLGFPFLAFKYLSKSVLIKVLRLTLSNNYEKTKNKFKSFMN